jgi:lipoyl(octanoyl) transferase
LHSVTNLHNYSFSSPPRIGLLLDWGLVSYGIAWEKQRSLVNERLDDPNLPDVLMLLEHPCVYTLGTGADLKFLKFDPHHSPWELHRIERGGEVTYHCPGQLVVYPILHLKYYQTDLHWYLRQLEEVIIRVLAKYNLQGYRIPNLTGVWLEGRKIAAIGIKVKRWVTMHGFAINVSPEMEGFDRIIPCGIQDRSVGRLIDFIPDLTVKQVNQDVIHIFGEVFNLNFN